MSGEAVARRVEGDFARFIRARQVKRSGEPDRRFFVDGIARCIFGSSAELDLFSDVSVEGIGTDLYARRSHGSAGRLLLGLLLGGVRTRVLRPRDGSH